MPNIFEEAYDYDYDEVYGNKPKEETTDTLFEKYMNQNATGSGMTGIIIVSSIALLGMGLAVYFFVIKKKRIKK